MLLMILSSGHLCYKHCIKIWTDVLQIITVREAICASTMLFACIKNNELIWGHIGDGVNGQKEG
jgi:hypothetical protein